LISAFVASYGYLAVFLGTLAEGETVLAAAGFAAHRGLLDWRWVIAVAVVGATLGDQLSFLIGRWQGPALLRRFPALAGREPDIRRLLDRHAIAIVPALRFMYGLRIAGPAILGSYRLPVLRFTVLNAIGATVWAVLIVGIGYGLGEAMGALLGDLRRIEGTIMIVIVAAGVAIGIGRRLRSRRRPPPGRHSG
jgi:membrane protein DedA with SNARE-associated domain